MEVTISDVMAVAAFGLSGYTLWRQRKGDELTRRLNALQIEKEQAESVSSKKADLFANFVKTGKTSYQFKIFNRGKGTARSVRMDVLAGNDLLESHDLTEKFPYPTLEPHQAISLLAAVYMGSPRRATVKLSWDDDAGGGEKTITDDVF
ncbi:hypothetical protein [Sphingomonas sp. Leaf28]|uniref:hypothetical protein n=1 Tax=Sphingomonas sp. Leaf28 TaxID=1735695 RepID=UPI0006F6FA66|nr:hypothetical protein [Sphingomonas sp. Leaf28]KQN09052.1 hypothetical protein ASE79_14465 [Sphingomonas sp. Leaf28]